MVINETIGKLKKLNDLYNNPGAKEAGLRWVGTD